MKKIEKMSERKMALMMFISDLIDLTKQLNDRKSNESSKLVRLFFKR